MSNQDLMDDSVRKKLRKKPNRTQNSDKKRQITVSLRDSVLSKLEQNREKTGIPISLQIELAVSGYEIRSKNE